MARSAMAQRYAQNAKSPREKKIYDATKARKNIENGYGTTDKDVEEMLRLNDVFKGFKPNFKKKGG